MTELLVLDASAMVALLMGSDAGTPVDERLRGCSVHVPAHFDAEVLSALGRLQRAGSVTARQVAQRLQLLEQAPFERHPLAPLLAAAWRLRANARLVDALYIALAARLQAPIITLDRGLAGTAARAELIEP